MHTLRHHPFAAALRALRWPLAAAAGALAPGLVLANPSGGQVAAGQATIGNTAANTLTINQASHSAVINWQQFSVDGGEFVVFNQPSASATVLNRVVGGLPSEVLGNLSANGRVFLVNPNGVMFGQGARVDVGGLVASTMNIADSDFMDGRYVFTGAPAGSRVGNAGQIVARDSGFVVLAGEQVSNSGLVQARLGKVALGSGSAMTLELDEAGLVGFSVDAGSVSALAGVDNAGDLSADGGSVILAARAARTLIGNAVNNRGNVRARSLSEHEGSIYLSTEDGDIAQDGLLDVSSTDGANGGKIRITARGDIRLTGNSDTRAYGAGGGDVAAIATGTLDYAQGAQMDAGARQQGARGAVVELSGHGSLRMRDVVKLGYGGRLILDPTDFTIGANGSIDDATLESLLRSNDSSTQVEIVASNSIRLLDLSDNLIDGTTADTKGAGLSLLIGSCTATGDFGECAGTFTPGTNGFVQFDDVNDLLKTDGAIVIASGTDSGYVKIGSLTSVESDIQIGDPEIIRTGNVEAVKLSAVGSVQIDTAGQITTNDIFVGADSNGTGSISLSARDGITTGKLGVNVAARSPNSVASGEVFLETYVEPDGTGGGDIVTGAINVTVGANGQSGVHAQAYVSILNDAADIAETGTPVYAGGGKVTTTGAILASAQGSPADTATCPNCPPSNAVALVSVAAEDALTLSDVTLAAAGANVNTSNLSVAAFNGSDMVLGTVTNGAPGTVLLVSQADRATGSTRLGSITATALNGRFSQLVANTRGSLTINGGNLQYVANPLTSTPTSEFASLIGGQVTVRNLTLDAGTRELNVIASGNLTVDNSDLAAQAIVLKGANMTLSGFLSGGTVMLQAPGVVQTSSTGTLDVDAGAVGVSARLIDLNRSSWTIGSNTVPLGQDSNLVSEVRRLAPSLQPALSAPNAAFEAQDGVTVGNLNFTDSGYLFLRSPSFFSGTISVGSGPLFFNARPFDDSLGIDVGAITSSPAFDALQTTYVLGGTGYNGDITVPPPSKALELGNDNVIFLTQGKVFNTDQIQTSGQVVVLGGTVTNQPPPQPPPPLDEQQMAAAGSAQLVVSDLGEQFMADSDTSLEFEDSSLVEETSDAPDDDLQCK